MLVCALWYTSLRRRGLTISIMFSVECHRVSLLSKGFVKFEARKYLLAISALSVLQGSSWLRTLLIGHEDIFWSSTRSIKHGLYWTQCRSNTVSFRHMLDRTQFLSAMCLIEHVSDRHCVRFALCRIETVSNRDCTWSNMCPIGTVSDRNCIRLDYV